MFVSSFSLHALCTLLHPQAMQDRMLNLERLLTQKLSPAAHFDAMGSASPLPAFQMFSSPLPTSSSFASSSSSAAAVLSLSAIRPNVNEVETARVATPGAKARIHQSCGGSIDNAYVRQFIKDRRSSRSNFDHLGCVFHSVAARSAHRSFLGGVCDTENIMHVRVVSYWP